MLTSRGWCSGCFTSYHFRSPVEPPRSQPPTPSKSEAARSTPSPRPSSWPGIDPPSDRPLSWKRCSLGANRGGQGNHRFQVVVGEVDTAAEKEVPTGDQAVGGGVPDLLIEDVVDAGGGEDVLEGLN